MTDEEIINLMRSSLDEVAPGWSKEVTDFGPNILFKDLAINSVQIMEMVGVIEEECSCQFADEDLAEINKVGDLIALIKKVAG